VAHECLTLEPPPGFRSREVALFVAQLDDLSRNLAADTSGLTPEALAWQSTPGMNTIGMLLAHIAIVEVFWVQIGPLAMKEPAIEPVLGIGMDDDGIPLPDDGLPPASLAGRDLAWYVDVLGRARAHTKAKLAALTDADLEREESRTRRNGSTQSYTIRWVLYHMVEHMAGHAYQINLIAHHHRIARGA
jgi:uncharacterized damage-inducible protein DinB